MALVPLAGFIFTAGCELAEVAPVIELSEQPFPSGVPEVAGPSGGAPEHVDGDAADGYRHDIDHEPAPPAVAFALVSRDETGFSFSVTRTPAVAEMSIAVVPVVTGLCDSGPHGATLAPIPLDDDHIRVEIPRSVLPASCSGKGSLAIYGVLETPEGSSNIGTLVRSFYVLRGATFELTNDADRTRDGQAIAPSFSRIRPLPPKATTGDLVGDGVTQ